MKFTTSTPAMRFLGAVVAGAVALGGGAALAQTVKIGTPTFLTGAAAPAFGIPAKNGSELIVRGINNGELPAPYNTKGFAGRQVEALIYDEAGGGTKQVTELRNKHATPGNENYGINVRKGTITDILAENVVQPLLVSTSALSLATECVRMILKIDDICPVR